MVRIKKLLCCSHIDLDDPTVTRYVRFSINSSLETTDFEYINSVVNTQVLCVYITKQILLDVVAVARLCHQ